MRKLLIILMGAGSVLAGPPPYPTDEAKGYVIEGIATEVDFTFVPGTVGTCSQSGGSTATTWNCDLSGAEARVEPKGGVKKTATLTRVTINERTGSATRPSSLRYYFEGKLLNTFPNGKTLEVEISLDLGRDAVEPNRLLGSIYTGDVVEIPTIAWLP